MALDTDDLAPPPRPVRHDLEIMSIEALGERIAALEAEIAAIRELIDKKRRSRDAAAALFRS